MPKERKIRRIFLYDEDTPTAINYEGAYRLVKAISDDDKHYFEFTVNQDDYENSLKELCAKFEQYCTVDCGFDDCRYCEVWSTYNPHAKIDHIHGYRGKLYSNTLKLLLGACTWATVCSMETHYYYCCSHLRQPNNKYDRPPTFDEFVTANGYEESDEPCATKKLFEKYNSIVNKKIFTVEELHNVEAYVVENLYLSEYKQMISFAVHLSDFFKEHLDINFFDSYHTEIKRKAKRYILNSLHTLNGALIMLYEYDKRGLKKLIKDLFDTHYKRYIKRIIKDHKLYGE